MSSVKRRSLKVVGLEYDSVNCQVPKLSIRDDGIFADQIVKIAKRFGVPILEKPTLVETLCQLELDQEIPEELF